MCSGKLAFRHPSLCVTDRNTMNSCIECAAGIILSCKENIVVRPLLIGLIALVDSC